MVLKDPREKLMIDERNKTLWLCLFKKSLLEKVLSGLNMCDWRLDMTARDKGAPDKGHTTLFSSSKVVHYFPNFRSYFGMEYEQPWNMGKVLLEWYWKRGLSMFIGFQLCVFQSLGRIKRGERIWTILAHWCRSMNMLYTSRIYIYIYILYIHYIVLFIITIIIYIYIHIES